MRLAFHAWCAPQDFPGDQVLQLHGAWLHGVFHENIPPFPSRYFELLEPLELHAVYCTCRVLRQTMLPLIHSMNLCLSTRLEPTEPAVIGSEPPPPLLSSFKAFPRAAVLETLRLDITKAPLEDSSVSTLLGQFLLHSCTQSRLEHLKALRLHSDQVGIPPPIGCVVPQSVSFIVN